MAAAIDHPNIIPIYEAGQRDGSYFLAMRFVDAPTGAGYARARSSAGGIALLGQMPQPSMLPTAGCPPRRQARPTCWSPQARAPAARTMPA